MKKVRKKATILLMAIVLAGDFMQAKAENVAAAPEVNVKEEGSYEVTFTYQNKEAQNVYVWGSFNNYTLNDPAWQMEKKENGEWELITDMADGVWQYRFVVDGIWVNDPENTTYYPDTQNNKLVVAEKSPIINGDTVTFNYPVSMLPADATKVTITGGFNNWAEQEMILSADGTHYTCSFSGLPANTYEYGFQVYTPATGTTHYPCRAYCGDYYNMHAACLGGNSVFTIQPTVYPNQPQVSQPQVNQQQVYYPTNENYYVPTYGYGCHGSYYNSGYYRGHRGHCH